MFIDNGAHVAVADTNFVVCVDPRSGTTLWKFHVRFGCGAKRLCSVSTYGELVLYDYFVGRFLLACVHSGTCEWVAISPGFGYRECAVALTNKLLISKQL